MKRFALPLTLVLLAACSRHEDDRTAGPSASEAAAALPTASDTGDAANAIAAVSRYTSLKACKLVESREDEDWSLSRCDGLGGITLQLAYGDARDDIQLVRAGRKPVGLGLPTLAGGGFNSLGETVEWRGQGEGAGFVPTALIVRNSSVQDPEKPEKPTALLAVIDLGQDCVVAQVKPGAGQNEQARAIADGPRRACLRS